MTLDTLVGCKHPSFWTSEMSQILQSMFWFKIGMGMSWGNYASHIHAIQILEIDPKSHNHCRTHAMCLLLEWWCMMSWRVYPSFAPSWCLWCQGDSLIPRMLIGSECISTLRPVILLLHKLICGSLFILWIL